MTIKHTLRSIAAFCILYSAICLPIWAQPTNFTYQGQLTESGSPASGIYDFQFIIYNVPDSSSPGAVALQTREVKDLGVTNGLFTAAIPFQSWIFNGEKRWLEVQVRTNATGNFIGLLPWTEITPAPYAVRALNVASNALAGEFGQAVSFPNPSNVFVGDGSGLTGATLDGLAAADFWQLGGNSGTTPTGNFIGTTDDQVLEFKVNGMRALRLEPTGDSEPLDSNTLPDGAPNIIGGSPDNFVLSGIVGATIAGGGATNYAGNPVPNEIRDNYAFIGGGFDNRILNGGQTSVIVGGARNSNGSDFAFIGAGLRNSIGVGSSRSVISGGIENVIDGVGLSSVISGGEFNHLSGSSGIVGGGASNIINESSRSAILGGSGNVIFGFALASTIAGGADNDVGVNSFSSTIGGGDSNDIAGNSAYSTIPGGRDNEVGSGAPYAFAAGRRAKANHRGAFVWADSEDSNFGSTANNQFNIRASGGVGIGTGSPDAQLHVHSTTANAGNNTAAFSATALGPHFSHIHFGSKGSWFIRSAADDGAVIIQDTGASALVGIGTPNPSQKLHVIGNILASGTITPNSDRNAKTDIETVDAQVLLERVAALPIRQWRFKAEEPGVKHVGPMAQDFRAAFGLGAHETAIATVDTDGVALAAIQGLNEKLEVRSQNAELNIRDLRAENASLRRSNAALEQRLAALERIIGNSNFK